MDCIRAEIDRLEEERLKLAQRLARLEHRAMNGEAETTVYEMQMAQLSAKISKTMRILGDKTW
jgi:prefoldin subunit 5